jgi:hypothetical protein
MIYKPKAQSEFYEITSADTIGYKDFLNREVLYCSPSNKAVILKKDGGITIVEDFKIHFFKDRDNLYQQESIFFLGQYFADNMSLKGGGKIYIKKSPGVIKSDRIITLNYDGLGNLLFRRAHSSYWDYTTIPHKLKYRFGHSYILFDKFEVSLIKRKHKEVLQRRRDENQL